MKEKHKQELISFFQKEEKELIRLSNKYFSILYSQEAIITRNIIDNLEKDGVSYAKHQLKGLKKNVAKTLKKVLTEDDRLKLSSRLKKIKQMLALLE